MTRRSVVGPLLLILVGVAFLLHNLRPDMPLARTVAFYWPYLLIAWGGLRLLEVLFLAARRRPYPLGLGAGEITAVVLICVFGTAMYSFHRHFAGRMHIGPIGPRAMEIFGETHEFPVEAAVPATGIKVVRLELGRGNAKIVGGELNEIRITGQKIIRSFSDREASQFEKQVPIEVAVEGDRAIVRFKEAPPDARGRLSADLELSVPKSVGVETRGDTGDFEIIGITGDIQVDSHNAGVRIADAGGNLKVNLRRSDIIRAVGVKGDVQLHSRGSGGDVELQNIGGQVRVEGSFGGTVQFENIAKGLIVESKGTELRVQGLPGRITMNLADFNGTRLVGPVRLVTRSRDVHIEDVTDTLQIETDRGDVEIRPGRLPLARMEIRSRAGNIELALPEKAMFELEGSTKVGEIHNDFGSALEVHTSGPSASIRGSVGKGAAIRISTQRGSVAVRKAGIQLPETHL
jgi:DUF4097 and DUF4098 domain-containing protein YvlB